MNRKQPLNQQVITTYLLYQKTMSLSRWVKREKWREYGRNVRNHATLSRRRFARREG